jgi:hypothetical protein
MRIHRSEPRTRRRILNSRGLSMGVSMRSTLHLSYILMELRFMPNLTRTPSGRRFRSAVASPWKWPLAARFATEKA